MADNLLKQAIADAKQVREMAYSEARNKLEEAFRPHLSSMLSQRLSEDNDASSEIGGGGVTVKEPAPKQPSKAASATSNIENPGLETDTFGDGSAEKKPLKEDQFGGEEDDLDLGGLDAEGEAGLDAAPMATDPAGDALPGVEMGMGGDTEVGAPDELDLEAIIRELELDAEPFDMEEPELTGASEFGAPDAGASPFGAEEEEVPMESFQHAQAGRQPTGAFDGPVDDEDLYENAAPEAKSGDGEFQDGKSAKAVDGVNGGKKVTPGQEITEELNLDEILRELQEDEDLADNKASKLVTENKTLRKSLQEHRDVVRFLKSKIQEINVLNAKLMYTNKLFRNYDLGLEQKKRIVESFDRTGSVREVKLVYSTLAEGFAGKTTSVRKKTAQAITEGMGSRPVGHTRSKAPAPILTEGTTQVSRWQKIAGIKKS